MARRFKSRATAERTFKTGVMVQFTAAANILSSATRGDGDAGTYHAPEASEVISTADFGPASGTSGTFVIPAEADVRKDTNYGVET